MGDITPERIVADILDQHRYRYESITCKARDWTYDGSNDFDEHQAKVIVAALRAAGYPMTEVTQAHVVLDGQRIIGVFKRPEDAELEQDEYPKRAGIPGTNLPALIRSRTTIQTHSLT